jgi:ATPase subunit of ABC transporter with duplicated ATPase domains
LIQALDQYEGTYVVVSHDRHFVSQVANKIWYIEDYEIKEYHDHGIRDFYKFVFYADSEEGKKRLAKFHSDKKWRYWNHIGPGWFHNLYSQRPYRRDAKRQIKRYIDNDIDVQLLRKPKREYWD